MVNRTRSETWTCGVKNEQVKRSLPSYSSETTLKLYSSLIKTSNDNTTAFHHDIKNGKTVTYDSTSWTDNDEQLLEQQRPVFSTSSMESVDLTDQKDSDGDNDSTPSLSLEPINQVDVYASQTSSEKFQGYSAAADVFQFEGQSDKKTSASLEPQKQQKSGFNSFFSWISSSRGPSKQQSASKDISSSTEGNCSQSLNRDSKINTGIVRKLSDRRTSVSLDRGINGLKSLKDSIKSTLTSGPGIRRNHSFEPLSTTALILEDRPSNLPSKSSKEVEKHQLQYNEMLKYAKKQEMKDCLKKEKLLKEQQKQEKAIANSGLIWANEIIPNWKAMYQTSRVQSMWWQGLPSSVRGTVWKLAIGNDLNITQDLYEIMLTRAHEKLGLFNEKEAGDMSSTSADKEATMDLIHLDIARTFPHLCIFQKGAPYYDLLHDILGAYVCYRPDVGYVQGMSFMAATLLLNMETADAFVAFANIMNKPCQVAFYRLDEDQIRMYFATYNVFFEENLPKLYAHFKRLRLTPDIYLIDWVFTIFTKALNLDVASRIWDLFCRDGEEFVFRTALAILKLNADSLLHSDFIHSAQLLTKLPKTFSQQQLFTSINDINMVARGNRRWKNVLASFKCQMTS